MVGTVLGAFVDKASTKEESLSLQQAFDQAVTAQLQQNHLRAEQLYRAVLRQVPGHGDSNHNLGVMALGLGRAAEALPYLQRALCATQTNVHYWVSFIEALLATGLLYEARESLARTVALGLSSAQFAELVERVRALPAEALDPLAYSLDEMGQLLISGELERLRKIALRLGLRHPQDALPKKILAAVWQREGDATRALEALLFAREIAPLDAEVHCNLGVIREKLGQLNAAEEAYRRALELQPEIFLAKNNLGGVLHSQGRLDEAVQTFRELVAGNPGAGESYNNLGAALKDQGHLQEAEACYRQALKVSPESVQAWNNLGALLQQCGRNQEAEAAYRHAIGLSDHPSAWNNLGNLLQGAARIAEAEEAYRSAIRSRPDLVDAYVNLANLLSYRDALPEETGAYVRARELDARDGGLVARVFLAVRAYLQSDFRLCQQLLDEAADLAKSSNPAHKAPKAYREYLAALLNRPELPSPFGETGSPSGCLHVIGDSHALSLHGQRLSLGNQPLRPLVSWVMGGKQWHLAKPSTNKFKQKVAQALAGVPDHEAVLFLFGEIDCRPDEGILSFAAKRPELPLGAIVERTIQGFVEFIQKEIGQKPLKVMVAAVPETNPRLLELQSEKFANSARLIPLFNARLKSCAEAAGFVFVELPENGVGWHLDDFHLRPEAYVHALAQVA